jgi:hypothetical protein
MARPGALDGGVRGPGFEAATGGGGGDGSTPVQTTGGGGIKGIKYFFVC